MLCCLQKGEIKALVLDSYVLDYAAGMECDLATVGQDFEECECCLPVLGGFECC